jgi:hypothetical protein
VITVLRAQPNTRSVGQPEPASFGLFICISQNLI